METLPMLKFSFNESPSLYCAFPLSSKLIFTNEELDSSFMISSLAFMWVDPAWGITVAFISTCPVPAPNSASQGHQPPQPILKERAAPRSSSVYPTLCAHRGSGSLKDSLNNVQPMPSMRLTVWWERSPESELNSEENQKEGRQRAVLSVRTAPLLVPKWAL